MAIHAFMRREWFTCSTCACNEDDPGHCAYNGCVIRWDPRRFGCGHYCSGLKEDEPRMTGQMTLEAYT